MQQYVATGGIACSTRAIPPDSNMDEEEKHRILSMQVVNV